MKRFILCSVLVVTLGGYSHVQAQFKVPEDVWGISVGGADGDNTPVDRWVPQIRGYYQYEFVPALLGQIGVGYTDLKAYNVYWAEVLMADIRLLVVPCSLPNLNPFLYGGLGVSKILNPQPGQPTNVQPIVPFGIGIQTRIASGLLLQLSGGYNLSLSTNLDGLPRPPGYNNFFTNGGDDGFFDFTVGLAFSTDDNAAAEEALRIQDSIIAAVEAEHLTDSTEAAAEALRVKEANVAEAQRMQDSANAALEAMHIKDSTDCAMQLAERKKHPDTLIVLTKGKAIVLKGVNFESNKATLTKDSEIMLQKAYDALVTDPDVRVVITGYTDNVGSQKHNQVLSLKRAQAVKNWLVKKGIAPNRMTAVGRGQNEPISSNATDEGRAENRRIEFYVQ